MPTARDYADGFLSGRRHRPREAVGIGSTYADGKGPAGLRRLQNRRHRSLSFFLFFI